MRKLIMSTAALALVMPLSMGNIQPAGAAVVAGSEVCGELPNAKWSWSISYSDPVITGGETSTEIGAVSYNTQGNVGKADVTVTTEPTISTTSTVCTALNPQGKVNADKSTSVETVVVLDAGGTDTTNAVVCNKGSSLPTCPL